MIAALQADLLDVKSLADFEVLLEKHSSSSIYKMQHAELARALIQRITNKLDGIGLLQD